MALQLVYTSIRSGLVAGRSGFCTAARHKELKESIVSRIEDFSNQYDRSLYDGQNGDSLPVIYQHRIISIRETTYHVLMRLGDAGNDYSGRTNHIAHAFILEASEVAGLRVSPAEAILAITKAGLWLKKYEESAKYFGPEDTISFQNFPTTAALPAQNWKNETRAAGNAALLFDDRVPQSALFATTAQPDISPERLLKLFSESLLLNSRDRSDPSALWSVPFTTLLQSASERRQFTWFGCLHDSDLFNKTKQTSPVTIGFERNISPPTSALADYAEGREPQSTTSQIESGPEISTTNPSALIGAETNPTYSETTALPTLQPLGHSVPEHPSSSIPLSTRDSNAGSTRKRKPQSSGLALTVSLLTLVALCAGGIAFWFNSTKEERAAEQIINALVEDGNWKAVLDEFKPRGSIDPKLSDDLKETYDFAYAFYRIEKISKNPEPDQVRAVIPGLENAGAAFNKIKKEVPRESEFTWLLAGRIEEAEKKIASWNALKNESSKLTKKISREAKWTEFTGEQLDGLIKEIENHRGELRDYETQATSIHARNASKFDETLPYLSRYRRLKFQTSTLEEIENAQEEISRLVNQIGRSKLAEEGEFIKLAESFKALRNDLAEKKKTELAKASETPDKNDEPTKVNLVEAASPLKTVIVPTTKSSDPIDLKIVESGFPDSLYIRTLDNLVESISTDDVELRKTGDKYYSGGEVAFDISSNTLTKINSFFTSNFENGFVLENRETQIQYVFQSNTDRKKPLYQAFSSEILSQNAKGELLLSEEVSNILSSIEIGDLEKPFGLQISYPPTSTETLMFRDPTKAILNWSERQSPRVTKLEDELKRARSKTQVQKLEPDFVGAGKALWPQYFSPEGYQRYYVDKFSNGYKIFIDGKSPEGIFGQKPIQKFEPGKLLPENKEEYFNYIQDNLEPLKELAKGSKHFASIDGQITAIITLPSADFTIFGKMTKKSINEKWAEPTITDLNKMTKPTAGKKPQLIPFQKKAKATEQLKHYRADRYCSDFFSKWNTLFSVENCEKLQLFFSDGTLSIPDLEKDLEEAKRIRDIPAQQLSAEIFLLDTSHLLLLKN